MERIEPEEFDVIVLGSGLPEALFASALARSGRSVLVIDEADFYGGCWSSLSWPSFQSLLAISQESRALANCQPATETAPEAGLSSSNSVVPTATFLNVTQADTWCSDHSIEHECRFFIVDLNPKVIYQGEDLINAMINCNIHNYIEFKMLEASYIFQEGALKPVPASKSDVFKTRDLTLLQKRALMQFLNSFLSEDRDTQAPIPGALSDLLTEAKLPPTLQTAILYGLAMADAAPSGLPTTSTSSAAEGADTPQHPAEPPQQSTQSAEVSQQPAPTEAADTVAAETSHPPTPPEQGPGSRAGVPASSEQQKKAAAASLSAEEGRAAVQLYMRSMGMYGGRSPFMLPLYGCGSVVEGYVRAAAVGGAVTVLRQRLAGVVVEGGLQGKCQGLRTAAGQMLMCQTLVACTSVLRNLASTSHATSNPTCPPPPPRRISRAVAVLDAPLQAGTSSCAVVLPPGTVKGAPPSAPAVDMQLSVEAAQGNPHTIRALQLGSTTCVTQSGRYLLHLVTEASCTTASGDLLPALSALACTDSLWPASTSADSPQPTPASSDSLPPAPPSPGPAARSDPSPASASSDSLPPAASQSYPASSSDLTHAPALKATASDSAPAASAGEAPAASAGEAPATGANGSAGAAAPGSSGDSSGLVQAGPASAKAGGAGIAVQPKVLHAVFYQQELSPDIPDDQLPSNVVACPDADPFMMGFRSVFRSCEELFGRRFPDARWLPEAPEKLEFRDEDEDDALADLRSAVGEISAATSAEPQTDAAS